MHLRSGKQRETIHGVCKSISYDYAAPVMAGASWICTRNDVFRFLKSLITITAERIKERSAYFLSLLTFNRLNAYGYYSLIKAF